ncbi:MAG: hypothetical protein AAF205_00015 [Pseudomonadota bacterium]
MSLEKDYRDVFSSDAGKRVLQDIVAKSGFAGEGKAIDGFQTFDPQMVAYKIGLRDMCGHILNKCGVGLSFEPTARPTKQQQHQDT